MTIHMIWAESANGFIGKDGSIPWHVPEDLQHFKHMTQGKAIVMGRKTWESLDGGLPNRNNVVISQTMEEKPGVTVYRRPWDVIDQLSGFWVIGGSEIFAAFLPFADHLVKTDIAVYVDGDVRSPGIFPPHWRRVSNTGMLTSVNGTHYRISEFIRND
jgi:dihydrofolate reductase